jgi:hypothetical protein
MPLELDSGSRGVPAANAGRGKLLSYGYPAVRILALEARLSFQENNSRSVHRTISSVPGTPRDCPQARFAAAGSILMCRSFP